MKRLLLLLPLCFLFLIPAEKSHAQFGDLGEILRSGTNDSNLLLENYLSPYAAGFGADLNSGWNNTARPYKKFGFDLRVSAAASFVPVSDELFNVSSLSFTQLEVLEGNSTPTIAGPDDVSRARLGQTFTNPETGNEEELYAFDMPEGTGFPYVPAPMVQLTVGVPFDTDVSLRAVPSIDIPDVDGSINLFGLGVKHGLNQWIPGGALLPVDLSAQVGYTQLSMNVGVDVEPQVDGDTRNDFNDSNWDDQNIELNSSGYVFNVLVGKTLPIISVYGGVGMQSSKMIIKTGGAYPLTVPNEEYNGQSDTRTKAIEEIVDPVDLDISGENNFQALAGFRVRLAFIAISGSYTLSKYPVANVGVGISFR
ncbi:MAG: DUF6588 family protein [Balneolaceae bacterium]